jgi:small-conductance mechanosensitive channel
VSLKNVPTGAWVFATVAVVALVAGFVVLAVNGAETSELRWLVLTLLNVGGGAASIGGLVYAGAAARSSQTAADRVNGGLDQRIRDGALDAARQALVEHGLITRDGR